MNIPTVDNLRLGTEERSEEKLRQVREILVGDYQRQIETRMEMLEERHRDLELSTHRRLDAIQARIDAIAEDVDAKQRVAVDEIAAAMRDVSDRVKRIKRD